MIQWRIYVCCLVLLSSSLGCAKKSTPAARAEGEQQVREIENLVSQAILSKDPDRLLSFYAERAALYDERDANIGGKKAIREAWQRIFTKPGVTVSTRPRIVEISDDGNMVWARGGFAMTVQEGSESPATERGDYALVYTRQPDGQFKIMADSTYSCLWNRIVHRPPEKATAAEAAIAPLIGLFCLFCGLWFMFGMPVVAVVCVWKNFRRRKVSTGLLLSVVTLAVFWLTAVLLWQYIAAHYWNLSLVDAFHAAGDTERFGNPIEDTAENVLVPLFIFSTLSAVAACIITALARWLWNRRQRAAA